MSATADQRVTDRTRAASIAPPPLERLHRYLEKLVSSAFYGKVTISFQNGKVSDVRIKQTKKLEELQSSTIATSPDVVSGSSNQSSPGMAS